MTEQSAQKRETRLWGFEGARGGFMIRWRSWLGGAQRGLVGDATGRTRSTKLRPRLARALLLGVTLAISLFTTTGTAAASGPLIIGNNASAGGGPIQTFDFSTGAVVNSFVPDGATNNNGRGVALVGNEVFYTELSSGSGATDSIHVAPFNNGAGGSDIRTIPNPAPSTGVQDLDYANGALYALTGYSEGSLQVWKLDPTSGAVLAGPIAISSGPSADGFTILPNGDFLINTGDQSCTYDEYNPTTGAATGSSVTVPGASTCTGVATDGVSLYFETDFSGFTQTDLSGNLISNRSVPSNVVEDISLVSTAPLPPPTVVTRGATNVQATSATVNGTVNPNGSQVTDCHFELGGPTTITVPCAQSVGAGTNPVQVSANVSGLLPSTTYYDNVFATNAGGTGTDQGKSIWSFVTQFSFTPNGVKVLSQAEKDNLSALADEIDGVVRFENYTSVALGVTTSLALSETGPFGIGVGAAVALAITVQTDSLSDQAKRLRTIAQDDPPDPNYQVIASPVLSRRTIVGRRVPRVLRRVLQRWLDNGRRLAADSEGWLVSYERAQGAVAAGNQQWIQLQTAATARFVHASATDMRSEAGILVKLRAAFKRVGLERVSLSVAQAGRLRGYVKRHGFPKAMVRTLVRAGANGAEVRSMEAAFVATPIHEVAGRIFARLTSAAYVSQLTKLAQTLDGY
jgi:hypothetical protein